MSQAGRLKGWLVALTAGAAAVALLAGLVAAATGAQAQEAGVSYGGSVDVLVANSCGGGSIVLTVGDDGASITEISLDGTYVGGVLVNTLADPPGGPFVIALDPPIAIADDGSFSETFQPVAGVDADFDGQFDGDTVSGSFGVTALSCTDVTYSAEAGVAPPTSTPAAAPTATAGAALPLTGTGTTSDGGSIALWVLIALGAGAVLLTGGLALSRKA